MGFQTLVSQLVDEVNGAKEYARCASADAAHREAYLRMAQAELDHASALREMMREKRDRQRTPEEAATELGSLLAEACLMADGALAEARARVGVAGDAA